jgi:hypothetical protein
MKVTIPQSIGGQKLKKKTIEHPKNSLYVVLLLLEF